MPHTTDKSRFEQCAKLLGGPRRLHYRGRVDGRRVLDTPLLGQQRLQALLFSSFNSQSGHHPWDSPNGRTLNDLRNYLNWVSPQHDRLIIDCNAPARVASFLLPHGRIFPDGSFEHAGIPGLRVNAIATGAITLRHLPTDGCLELRETPSLSAATLRHTLTMELERHDADQARNGGATAMWALDRPDPAEEAAADSWQPRSETSILSGLMARAALFWRSGGHDTTVVPSRRSNGVARIGWSRGYSARQMAELLTSPAVGIPGAMVEASAMSLFEPVLLRVNTLVLELNGPLTPRVRTRPGSSRSI